MILPYRSPPSRANFITSLTGFSHEDSHIRYLGVPLFSGRARVAYFHFMLEKVQTRISGWFGKLFSLGGKIVLIKHVLSSIPIHLLAAVIPPAAIIQKLESMFANFLWNSSNETSKHHWISWSSLARPLHEGGIGIRSLNLKMSALHSFSKDAGTWSRNRHCGPTIF